MSANSGEGTSLSHRPRNNLVSSKHPQFTSKGPSVGAEDLVRSHRDYRIVRKKSDEGLDPALPHTQQSSSAAFIFTGQIDTRLSELGDSSSLFSFDSPRPAGSFGAANSPHFKFRTKSADSKLPSTFGSSPPSQFPFRPFESPNFTFSSKIARSKDLFTFESSPPPQRTSQRRDNPRLEKALPSKFLDHPSRTMVVEREPPKAPLSPAKPNQQPQNPSQPAFGKTSTLQSPLRTSMFNIPKPNQARPEHHRPKPPTVPTNPQPVPNAGGGFKHTHNVPTANVQQPKNLIDDEDVVEIPKPANMPSWSSYPARPPTFSSGVASLGGFASVSQPKFGPSGNFVDLIDAALFADRFGSADPYDYVDAGKAAENIKALLEGAFEDDEEMPRTRGRKKKLQKHASQLINKLGGLSMAEDARKDENLPEEEDEEEEEEEEEDGTVEGLKVKLLPHQVDGVEWMREKEASVKKKNGVLPKGGILADDMGLGKTVQSIALLLTNPRPPLSTGSGTDSKSDKHKLSNSVGKGTLVVAPLALIKQWEAEIANRVTTSHKLRVCVHHGPQRTKRFEDLRKYDVVITTYQILVSEHGNSADGESGPQVGCFGIHWYRVILDEAHTIKNRNAKATQACCALRAEYRWCLTGTPMQNNLDELQSLIKFLRIKPYNELGVWRDQITRPLSAGRGGVAMKRLQFYLKAFMKRRTKDVLKAEGALNPGGKPNVEGKPTTGFKITERKIEKVVATFADKERRFYDRLEQRTDQRLEQMMGGSKMSYASALVLLLRLRQACNHPELVGGSITDDKDALTTGQATGSQTLRKSKFVDEDLDNVADLLGGLSVQTKQCDVCQTELTKEESRNGSIRCGTCDGALVEFKDTKKDTKKASKQHKSRKHATTNAKSDEHKHVRRNRPIIMDSDDEDNEEGEGEWVVAESQRHRPRLSKAGGSDDENAEGGGEWLASEDSETGDEASVQILGSHKKKVISLDSSDEEEQSSSNGSSEEDDEDDSSSDDRTAASMITSTKIQHLLHILRRESGTHKFIVFSQFTSMLNLIEPFLKSEGLVYTRYDGSMRNDHREASLNRLRNEKRTRILLCSLKCGSLGLNLTAASRVVILEPFWNPFVEEQAIDRVHRLNQTVDVVVYKITIANSVEERILDLQEKKRALASAAIEGKAVAKLSMQDILNLFRRDAEHDARHELDSDLGVRTRVLPAVVPSTGATESRRSTPPVIGRGKAPVKEDPLYGRRW
ncbi:hypothetical protein MMC30_000774 [Trapelia coarctata]|nr:hypothetical protein [Trapelia coarctata]